MASREEVSYPILRKHDVDYVLIVFGGLIGFSGDDINKFLWFVTLRNLFFLDLNHVQDDSYRRRHLARRSERSVVL